MNDYQYWDTEAAFQDFTRRSLDESLPIAERQEFSDLAADIFGLPHDPIAVTPARPQLHLRILNGILDTFSSLLWLTGLFLSLAIGLWIGRHTHPAVGVVAIVLLVGGLSQITITHSK